jgi:protein-arginine kinase activator protein McsA
MPEILKTEILDVTEPCDECDDPSRIMLVLKHDVETEFYLCVSCAEELTRDLQESVELAS